MCQFKSTFELFDPAIKATQLNLNKYEGWIALPQDLKAAGLFVQFFSQITLAWNKCKRDFIEDELAVSTVMQYLIKAVPLIEWQRNRYKEAYIYTTAFNCLFPLTRLEHNRLYYYNELHNSLWEIDCEEDLDKTDGLDQDNTAYTETRYRETVTTDFIDDLNDAQSQEFWKWIWGSFKQVSETSAIETVVGGKKKMTAAQQKAFERIKPEILGHIMCNQPDILNQRSFDTEMTCEEARDIIVKTTQVLSKVYRLSHPLPLHDEAALNKNLDDELAFINAELARLIPDRIRKLAV